MDGKQLRNSILQWAIQGKLVPQDPNDEPASVLLKRIREEKARLVKEKKIKRDKNESIIYRGEDNSYYEKIVATGKVKCIDDEIPYELPKGWNWCRLSSIASIYGGKRIPVGRKLSTSDTGHKYIRVSDMKNSSVRLDDIHYIAEDIYQQIKAYTISKDDLYITVAGTIGAVGEIPDELDNANLTENADKVVIYMVDKRFLMYLLQSELVQTQIRNCTTKVGQPKLAIMRIQNLLIALPPINEEKRIVKAIETILPLILRYSQVYEQLKKRNSELIDKIKKSILHESIQGKLVEQDPKDEPASVLLERIKQEKERLVNEKKIKRDKQESIIYRGDDNKYWEKRGKVTVCIDDEIPFDIPNTWEWTRFGSLINMRMGKTPPRGDMIYWSNGTTPWVTISDMSDYGIVKSTKEKVSDYAVKNAFGDNIVSAGTLLMSFKLTVGRTSILDIDALHNEAIISIKPYIDNDHTQRDYLFYVLPLIANYGESKDAIKGKTLNSTSLYNLLIPLPPLREQRRIINAIETAWQVL